MENQHEELRETGGNLAGRIEAILFVAGEPVRIEELAKALGVSVREIESELVRIRDEYDFHQYYWIDAFSAIRFI